MVSRQVLFDLSEASKCVALVGTFSASISKLVFALMLTKHDRVPPFASLGGCATNLLKHTSFDETCKATVGAGARTMRKQEARGDSKKRSKKRG